MAQGFIIWFTGLSGSGKSTLAAMVSERLRQEGVHVEALDGDEVRKHLSWGLGFSREDRDRNVRRIGYVARLVARSGACAITAAISPFRSIRDEIRSQTDRFCEVYCECPLEVLAERDPKGLYKRALAGEIKNFTGVDDPYEPPENPEIHLRTDETPAEECVEIIVRRLGEMGYLSEASERWGLQMPPPYGGELHLVPLRPLASVGLQLEVDEETKDACLALGAGFLSPVAGFMSQREAEKVRSLKHLEQGFAWPRPQMLPISAPTDGIEVGACVRLTFNGQQLAQLQVQEVFVEDRQHYAAGTLEALAPDAGWEPSARKVRALARDRGWRYFPVIFERGAPTEEAKRALRSMASACDGAILLTMAQHFELWKKANQNLDSVIVLELPRYVERHSEFEEIVGRNLGGWKVLHSCLP